MSTAPAPTVFLLPGLYNSGPEHWQTFWERERTDCRRIEQAEWNTPRREDWVATLDRAIVGAGQPVVLVAHSLACILVAHWAASKQARVRNVKGALLVAPSDVEAPDFPAGTSGFAPMPRQPLPFPSVVVASTNDAYITMERVTGLARDWGSRLVNVGAKDHLGSAARLGTWPEGQVLLGELLEGRASR
ncbi:RBBP9/YdeN family alpha/beta hydrolase [Pyxidicoccus xibeiensis]|uniref:RBBP9/YdeN family alpha/beta hydrolase n=1 Tax=Pyxidicoccus xibeiensis TaxID=2906759 RepID=UPI0020A7E137|nr:alpha/beta hydrolase [Pyxidicoccus xibeiensis]MCP3141949.1 alpha/beta hydrolase [Pyxidicoccus xibeiensis]